MTKSASINPKLINQLLETYHQPEDPLSKNDLLKPRTKALLKHALNAKMTHHLSHPPSQAITNDAGHKRNDSSQKTVQAEFNQLEIKVARNRDGSFKPHLVKKRQTRLRELDACIVNLDATGMSTCEIRTHLEEMCSVEVSPGLRLQRHECGER
jgi:transposase-like protein